VWRTRKPHAFLGLPVIGRHTAYVGETGSRYFRDRQHRYGDSRYQAAGKPWSDLKPKVYPLPCLFPASPTARKIQEKLWIWLLLPVYNVEWNTKNPRRITPMKAQQQRWWREEHKAVQRGAAAVRAALALALTVGLTYMGWERII
jgi:hypothetical protein